MYNNERRLSSLFLFFFLLFVFFSYINTFITYIGTGIMGSVISKSGLTDRQETFCQEYVTSFNGTLSAIRAGYNENSAYSSASDLLKNPKVLARIQDLNQELAERRKIDQEIIVRKLQEMTTFRITDMIRVENGKVYIKDTDDLPDTVLDNITGLKQTKDGVEVKFSDRQKALVDLGRYFGMFVDRMAVTTDLTVKVDDFTDANYNQMNQEAAGQIEGKKEGKKGENYERS